MRIILFSICVGLFLNCCQALPQLFQSAEDIATDDVLSIEIDKGAMQKQTDIDVNVKIYNKDKP